VTVIANFANTTGVYYLIDANAKHPLAWTNNCVQDASLLATNQTDAKCTAFPSFVTESLDTSVIPGGGPYSSYTQGGYTTTGLNLFNTLTVMQQDQTFTNISTVNMYAVDEIYANVWQYNVS